MKVASVRQRPSDKTVKLLSQLFRVGQFLSRLDSMMAVSIVAAPDQSLPEGKVANDGEPPGLRSPKHADVELRAVDVGPGF